jgi:hypothetical protein
MLAPFNKQVKSNPAPLRCKGGNRGLSSVFTNNKREEPGFEIHNIMFAVLLSNVPYGCVHMFLLHSL